MQEPQPQYRIKRGDNAKGFDINVGRVDLDTEFESMDQLGPNARQALRDSPIKWLAYAIVKQIAEAEEEIRAKLPEDQRENFSLDLQHPDLDRNIARGIMLQSMQTLLKDRSNEDAAAGIVPLRSKRLRRRVYR